MDNYTAQIMWANIKSSKVKYNKVFQLNELNIQLNIAIKNI